MKLFEIIPYRLFSVFTSKNREVYTDVLFALQRVMQRQNVSRQEFVSVLLEEMEEELFSLDLVEDQLSEGAEVETQMNARAYAQCILRHFRDVGWIRLETDPVTFEEMIVLPYYAIPILETLLQLSSDEVREYASFVHATYATLKTAQVESDGKMLYAALQTAVQNTRRLWDELRMLLDKIYDFHQRAINEAAINQLLIQHFEEYKRQLHDKVIYPLMTVDSVARFKTPILSILRDWQDDPETLGRLTAQALQSHRYSTEGDAVNAILVELIYVSDTYSQLDKLIADIKKRQTAYTGATTERVNYYLNADHSVASHLAQLLNKLAHANENMQRRMLESMVGALGLFTEGFIDEESLYQPPKKKCEEASPQPIVIEAPQVDIMDGFLKEISRQYNRKQVRSFILGQMDATGTVSSEQLRMHTMEDLALTMLAAIQADEDDAPYTVEFFGAQCDNGRFRIPRMVFRRRR